MDPETDGLLEDIAKYTKKVGRSVIVETDKRVEVRFPGVISAQPESLEMYIDSKINSNRDLELKGIFMQPELKAGRNISISDSVVYLESENGPAQTLIVSKLSQLNRDNRFRRKVLSFEDDSARAYGPKTFEERLPELEKKIFQLGEPRNVHESPILFQTEEEQSGNINMDNLGEQVKTASFYQDVYPQLKENMLTLGKLGNLSLRGRNYEEAMKYFTLALHILPPRMHIWDQTKLAFKHTDRKDYWFNEFKYVAEDDEEIWLKKAELAQENDMDVNELESYRRTIALNFDNRIAKRGIERVLSKYTGEKSVKKQRRRVA